MQCLNQTDSKSTKCDWQSLQSVILCGFNFHMVPHQSRALSWAMYGINYVPPPRPICWLCRHYDACAQASDARWGSNMFDPLFCCNGQESGPTRCFLDLFGTVTLLPKQFAWNRVRPLLASCLILLILRFSFVSWSCSRWSWLLSPVFSMSLSRVVDGISMSCFCHFSVL